MSISTATSLRTTTIMDATRGGLESGLRVLHIATMNPECAEWGDPVTAVVRRSAETGFDCMPVRREGHIVGYIEPRPIMSGGVVQDHTQQLDGSALVSADLPLSAFIPMLRTARFKLVVNGTGIDGIVTRSDLQKLPVRLFAFSLITHLEMVMREAIQALLPRDEDWLPLLSPGRQDKVDKKWGNLHHNRMEPARIEATDYCDKRQILLKHLRLGRSFEREMEDVEKLRDTIAHAGVYAETDDKVQEFITCLEQAEKWIVQIEAARSTDRSGGSGVE